MKILLTPSLLFLFVTSTFGADLLRLELDLGRGDGNVPLAQWNPHTIWFHNNTDSEAVGSATWTLHDDEGTLLQTMTTPARTKSMAKSRLKQALVPPSAGLYKVGCSVTLQAPQKTMSTSMMLAFLPERITSPPTREDDFAEFWKNTKTELRKVPPEFALARRPNRDSKTHQVFEVTMRSLGRVRVAGWYEKPKAAGAHPALLRVPGYGATMRPTGQSAPWIIFSFNPRGHGNSQADVKHDPVNYWIRGLDQKEDYYYRGAYADCLRAVDFLCSRSEVDKTRIAVSGDSQGGGLSLATAALDQRITLCAPDIPFLCDWKKYFQTSHWPEIGKWIAAKDSRTWETTLRTMSYFDTLNLAEDIRCPVLFGLGLQDKVCPAATIFSVYNRIETLKEFHLYPHSGHGLPNLHRTRKIRWLHQHFGTKPGK